jgi:hypothetical protein
MKASTTEITSSLNQMFRTAHTRQSSPGVEEEPHSIHSSSFEAVQPNSIHQLLEPTSVPVEHKLAPQVAAAQQREQVMDSSGPQAQQMQPPLKLGVVEQELMVSTWLGLAQGRVLL